MSNRTKIKYAQGHNSIFLAEIGHLKQQLTTEPLSQSATSVESIELLDNTTVEVRVKHPKTGKMITFLTPFTNFSVLAVADEI